MPRIRILNPSDNGNTRLRVTYQVTRNPAPLKFAGEDDEVEFNVSRIEIVDESIGRDDDGEDVLEYFDGEDFEAVIDVLRERYAARTGEYVTR